MVKNHRDEAVNPIPQARKLHWHTCGSRPPEKTTTTDFRFRRITRHWSGASNPEPNANQMQCQQNRTTGLVSVVNRNTTVLPLPAVCVCQTSPRRQKALYHNRNSCCSFTQLWHYKPTRCYWKIRYYFYLADRETTQVTHRQNTGNEAHNYCGINQCINYPHYRDECNYRLQTGIFDWHAVK